MDARQLVFFAKDFCILLICTLVAIYLSKKRSYVVSSKTIKNLFVGWILFWTFEYWFLGPASHIHFYDEADTALVRYLYDLKYFFGGTFSHDMMGGIDHYAQQLVGGQLISLEKILLFLFPMWIAILFHKVLLVGTAVVGMFILLKRLVKISDWDIFCFSLLFSTTNPYLTYSSFHHGIGYAFLPLAIYIFLARNGEGNYLLSTIGLSFLMVISTAPTHSLMVVICGILISCLYIKLKKLGQLLLALIILLILTVINWGEVLFGMKLYGPYTERIAAGTDYNSLHGIIFEGLLNLNSKTEVFIFGHSLSFLLILMLVVVLLALFSQIKKEAKLLLAILAAFYLGSVIYLLPLDLLHLSFLKSVNFYRVSFVMIVPLTVLAARLYESKKNSLSKFLPAVFCALALFYSLERKFDAVLETALANQKRLTSISALNDQSWWPKEDFRAVTASSPYLHGLHPNFLLNYGIATLDGYTNLVPSIQVDFWYYGIHRNIFQNSKPTLDGGNLYLSYSESSSYSAISDPSISSLKIAEKIDLNLLRLLNVSHIVSYLPLEDASLVKITGPKDETSYNNSSWARFTQRVRTIFSVPDVYIYSLQNFSPRLYLPNKKILLANNLPIDRAYRFISENYCAQCFYSTDIDLHAGDGRILHQEKIINGYAAEIEMTKGGVLVLNHFYLPFWKAIVDGQPVPVAQVNMVNMAIKLSPGKHHIEFLYQRKLLKSSLGFN